ncbi:MAG: Ferric transporter ATP-binding subunit [Hyphomicrobiales bacterium]|nr:Ferric transporter ATP-binding subunit [Hyphomicrobiales bacterium]
MASIDRRTVLAGAASLALAPRGAFAQGAKDALVAAAKKDGKLIIYNGSNFPVVRRLGAQFASAIGISVDVLDGRTTEIRERIRVEQATGRTVASCTFTGMTTLVNQEKDGAFQPHGPIAGLDKIDKQLAADGTIAPLCVGNFASLINTNLVKGDDVPKSWRDFADPKWKGKILSDDPRAAGAGAVWFEATLNAFGREFHEKMAAQNVVFSRIFPESQRRLARGEFSLYLPFNVSELNGLKGLPVQCVVPAEGVPYVPFCMAVLKDAPQPSAARLFIEYMLEEPQQVALAGEGFKPALVGMGEKIPAHLRPFVDVKLLGTTTAHKLDEMNQLARQIYGSA